MAKRIIKPKKKITKVLDDKVVEKLSKRKEKVLTPEERELQRIKEEKEKQRKEKRNIKNRKKGVPFINHIGQVVVYITGEEKDAFDLLDTVRYSFRVCERRNKLQEILLEILSKKHWNDLEWVIAHLKRFCEIITLPELYEKFRYVGPEWD